MTFKAATCPNCGGALQVPDDRMTVTCMYCAGTVVVREAIQAAAAASLPNLLKLARTAAAPGNCQEAYEYYSRVLEIDANNVQAWTGKAEACGRLTSEGSFRLPEMVGYYGDAIEAADANEKDETQNRATEVICSVTVQYYRNARDGLSPAFIENASWMLYLATLGKVLQVLDQALQLIPNSILILQTTLDICKDNSVQVSYTNRYNRQRTWRTLAPEWNHAIRERERFCSEKLAALKPDLQEVATLHEPVTLADRTSRRWIIPLLVVALVVLFALLASLVNDPSPSVGSQNSGLPQGKTPTPMPAATNVRCDGYKNLTYHSNYEAIVRLLGPPDSESSKGPPEAVIPNIFMSYPKCGFTVISIYGERPKNGTFNKATTRYVGTKSANQTLHVSQERFRALVDALPPIP